MRLEDTKLADDAEVLNGGEYVAYAEVSTGRCTLEFERASEATITRTRTETWKYSEPLDGRREIDADEGKGLLTEFGGWDYVETADEEKYESNR